MTSWNGVTALSITTVIRGCTDWGMWNWDHEAAREELSWIGHAVPLYMFEIVDAPPGESYDV